MDIRCFFAIELPGELKARLHQFIADLKTRADGVKWVKSDSLHITLKFMGNLPERQVDTLITALISKPVRVSPFEVRIAEFGAFPNHRRPRVFWLGVESLPRQPLYSLFRQLEARLEPLGYEKESRRFAPHLTMGRVKSGQTFDTLWQWTRAHPFEPFRFSVDSFVLMQSILKPGGAEYKQLQKYPLHDD